MSKGDSEQPPKPDELREALFDKAKYGKMTGEEADAEAERLGLGRLSSRPSDQDFNATLESFWNPVMSVAWIAYRSMEAVTLNWDKYCSACTDWHWQRWRAGPGGEIYEGWILEERARPSLARLGIMAAYDKLENLREVVMDVAEARDALNGDSRPLLQL